MSGLEAGRLNRRINVTRPQDMPDGHGGFITTWQPVATIWAEVISQNGREAVLSQALQGVSSYRITVRYRPDLAISPKYQIDLDGKTLNVRSVADPDGRRVALVIFADTEAVQA